MLLVNIEKVIVRESKVIKVGIDKPEVKVAI
jgi:hypothetical protein